MAHFLQPQASILDHKARVTCFILPDDEVLNVHHAERASLDIEAMVNPFLLVPLLLLKKGVVWKAVELYGYPRMYRRVLEGMKTMKLDPAQSRQIKDGIKSSIRFPATAINFLSHSNTVIFLNRFVDEALTKSGLKNKVPPFVVEALKHLVKNITPAGKVLDTMDRVNPKDKDKK